MERTLALEKIFFFIPKGSHYWCSYRQQHALLFKSQAFNQVKMALYVILCIAFFTGYILLKHCSFCSMNNNNNKKPFSLLTQQQDRSIYKKKLKKEVTYNTIDYIFDPHFNGVAISKMENCRNLHLCFHGFIPLIKLSSSETPTHFPKCEAFGKAWDSWQVKLQNS